MHQIRYYSPIILQKFGRILFWIIYKIFLRLEVIGRENLEGLRGPVILAANHTSELDVTLFPIVLPFFSPLFPIYYVANPVDKYKTFGWRSYVYGGVFFNILGGYSVYSGHHDYSIALETHEQILKSGGTVCIFPEGKRTRDGFFNPARGGLGYLVYATGATVVPITIDTFFHLSIPEFFSFSRKIRVTIGKPMLGSEITGTSSEFVPSVENYREWSQIVLDKIKQSVRE